ncbi:GEVED domain-containing protein [Flavobacterium luminosum]|uniref:GEVED domain-containing protein n=1 Tax=Flavobacterium luminosum TaxID=2949086 RepID=A0ABT0TKQ9_9FLAO|nr:GEVED domain-containing protein [Flavobacterium sp. HXWNR70]MCL9807915.1 GEVED domain-containing protein [Flavobacterium sp. HXWNR70]
MFLNSSVSWGQVTITKPSLTVTAYCGFPTDYYPLGDIVITEKDTEDFSLPNIFKVYSVVLTAPTNFEFKPNTGAVTADSDEDITNISINVTATAITITYSSSEIFRNNELDKVTISGIEVRGTTAASTGSIYRSGGSGIITGLEDSTPVASLTSVTSTAVPAITTNPANATVAAGGNTSFTVVASNHPTSYTWEVSTNGGSTWSTVTNGGVYSNATTATLNITGATLSMDGYQYRVRATNGCGASAYSTAATLTVSLNYCNTATSTSSSVYINSFQTVGNITNLTNSGTGYTNSGYTDYTNLPTTTQIPGGGITAKYDLAYSVSFKAWVDWNKDGVFNDTTERVYDTGSYLGKSTSFGFVVPTTTTPGTYRMRVRAYDQGLTSLQPCGALSNGETEDYKITIIPDCSSKITSVTDGARCDTGTVTLSANATAGTTEWRWYTAETGGTLAGSSNTSSWTTPSLSTTTTYWVAAWNGSCESYFRKKVVAKIKPIAGLSFTTASPTVCGEESIISLDAAGGNEEVDLVYEDFEGPAVLTTSNATATGHEWTTKASTFIPTGTALWRPAINSREAGNKFAYTTCNMPSENVVTRLISNSLSSATFTSLTLTFRHYFSYYASPGDHGYVQYSIDNGASWINLYHFQSDQGEAGQFKTETISLPASCLNITTLKIRFSYESTGGNGWAVDDIRLYGSRPLVPNFTWTGTPVDAYTDAACTIPYTAGTALAGTTVWIKPTLAQLELGSYSFTANANLANGCTTSATINVTNKSKVWKGTTSNDWNVSSNWLPAGVPDATTCVIIPTGTSSKIINAPTALAKNLTVKAPTGNLELQTNQNLIVTDWVKVENGGVFNIRNSANLVQLNDTPSPANSGNITMNRTANNLHLFDYVYWSSPVENFAVTNVSPLTPTSKIYHWVTTHNNGTGYGYGNWLNVNENMVAGKGYIVRVPNANTSFSTTFTGKPHNGMITKGVARGPYNTGVDYLGTNGWITTHDDNWNLVGNPYPSAIDAIEFLAANSGIIEGEVNLWTHSSAISNTNTSPYYQTFSYNYKSNDYVTYNASGNNIGATIGFNGKIAAGQGFFVKMIDGGVGTANLTFNNSMRTDGSNNAYNNGQFYRTSSQQTATTEPEKHRIWLDLIDSNMNTSRFMTGYIEGATNDKDHLYDARTNYTESLKAFTMVDQSDDIFVIQGRSLPFDPNDKINFGIQVPANATYKIAIADVDGLFKTEGQKIYVEDLLTNTTHDLTLSPYSFTSDKGIFKNRFVIKFNDQKLSNTDNEFSNSVVVFGKEQLTIKSELFSIKEVTVYDVLGKTLLHAKDITEKEYQANALRPTNTVILVKATLENGAVITKKVIF